MKTKPLIVAALIAASVVFAGCSKSNTPAGGTQVTVTGGTSVAVPASMPAKAAAGKPTCDLAPAALVNSTLGTNVAAPQAQNLDRVVVCRYSPASGSGSVVVRIQTDMSQATFTASRKISDNTGMPTTDLPGFADLAYTSTLKAGSHTTNTVVALKGTVELIVASPASFTAEQSLETQLFDKLT